MVEFVTRNINPKQRITTDCVVRALTVAIHNPIYDIKEEYKNVLNELVQICLKTGYMINDKHTYEQFLTNHGFIKYKQPRKADNTKYKIGEINKVLDTRYNEDISTCVISCAHHLTVYTNVIIDTWDCRRKTINNYWVRL